MAHVRIHEVVGTVRLVDGDSLLSGPVLERIVEAVLEAVRADRRDAESRRRDTRIGEAGHEEDAGDRR
jgi:hypothetical protein